MPDPLGLSQDEVAPRQALPAVNLLNAEPSQFDELLFSKLQRLELTLPASAFFSPQPLVDFQSQMYTNTHPFVNNHHSLDSFNLPAELQGGIGNILSRRPSYAAESFTRSVNGSVVGAANTPPPNTNVFKQNEKHSLAALAAANNYNYNHVNQLTDLFAGFNLSSNYNRRPSQIATPTFNPFPAPKSPETKLDNGLVYKDQYVQASPALRKLASKVTVYYQDVNLSNQIVASLHQLLTHNKIIKLVTFIKILNNLSFNHKMLCLVVNKNGKLDLLLYINNSNFLLQKNDLVIVDGDRGKDLVQVLEPLVTLDFAILFGFLKKYEHLKSLTIVGNTAAKKTNVGTHLMKVGASAIINAPNNEDNEFLISLPTKQVTQFASAKDIHGLSTKFLEERKAFTTCFNKIKELNLQNDLELVNVEYQSDFKKLIFYYFAKFKRIDFRGLIKELFKVYKTRIWLCAVLPHDRPQLYTTGDGELVYSPTERTAVAIPQEYQLINDQLSKFSIHEFASLAPPNYFHLRNFFHLVEYVKRQLNGNFYGFADDAPAAPRPSIAPNFNPFGDI